jgi:dihydroxyacetone kinase
VAKNVRSLGVSFSSCSKAGEAKQEERMAVDEMEVGLGIHGEPGFKKMKLGSADDIAKMIAESLLKTVDPNDKLAVMIGNLGSVPPMEMTLFTHSLMKYLPAKLIVGPASLMTSLDMNGIQVSICALGSGMEGRLLAPTAARAWPGAVAPNKPALVAMPLKAPPAKETNPVRDQAVEAMIKKACEALIAATAELNELDGKVGDGDCGSTMKLGAESVLRLLGEVSTSSPKALFSAIGSNLDKLGGSSGVLLSIMFTTMAGSVAADAKWTKEAIAPAFALGVETIMGVGGAKPGMRTMIDVMHPVAEAMQAGISGADLAKLAQEKADATAMIKSTTVGRSMY